ncbi:MAG: mechanosensitive ion channel family protein [Verrucomicrobiota bacterium]
MTATDIFQLANSVLHYTLITVNNTPITLASLLVFICVFCGLVLAVKLLTRTMEQRLLKRFNLDKGSQYAIIRIIRYALLVLAAVFSFQFIGLSLGGLAVLFGFLSVGIGFGLQNITSNFVAGLILLFERPVKVGDRVTIGQFEGDIIDINMRATTVQTLEDRTIIVPNSQLVEREITNWSYGNLKVRLRIDVGVSYSSDLDTVMTALQEVARENPDILDSPKPLVRFVSFGDSSWNLFIAGWIQNSESYYRVQSDLHCAIVRKFRERGVEIPFPQRDLHFRTAFPQTETNETLSL